MSLAGRRDDVLEAAGQFALPAAVTDVSVLERGHIHQSFVVTCHCANGPARFLFQAINVCVFRQPHVLMRNAELVTRHLVATAEPSSICLRLVATKVGAFLWRDQAGNYWRAFHFIDGSVSFDAVRTASQAFDVGRAFGRFQHQMLGLDVDRLQATIPDFHHTAVYYRKLEAAVGSDRHGRLSEVRDVVQNARRHHSLIGELDELVETGQIPLRIAHNDAKLDNVLFDENSAQPMCVIDLDTVMPGLAIHDFGDLVRTSSGRFTEDEPDLGKVDVDLDLFRSLAEGYLVDAYEFLTVAEIEHMVYAAKLITFETGVRFLTDHLAGDTYFHVRHPGHNLERCQVQFRLLECIESNERTMVDIVNAAVSKLG